jgi:lysophospholipase L1-like esterase
MSFFSLFFSNTSFSGEFSCKKSNSIQEFCTDSTVTNEAISGSTAYQWGAGGTYDPAEFVKKEHTHIWFSAGGNDYMTPAEDPSAPGADSGGCKMSNADFTTRMQGAIDKIKKAATDVDNKNVKIVLTGYCVPTKPECDGSTDLDVPIAAMKAIAASEANVEFYDISERCGGKSGPKDGSGKTSNSEYFVDAIHLNKRGYCKAFTMPSLQTGLGCTAKEHDCSAVPEVGCSGSSGLRETFTIAVVAVLGMVAAALL